MLYPYLFALSPYLIFVGKKATSYKIKNVLTVICRLQIVGYKGTNCWLQSYKL